MITKRVQRRVPKTGRSYTPPAVGNDNIRPRFAVNDNLDPREFEFPERRNPRRSLPKLPKTAKWLRLGLRASPWLAVGGFAFDYIYQSAQEEYTFSNLGDWTLYATSPCSALTSPIKIGTGGSRANYGPMVEGCFFGHSPAGVPDENPFASVADFSRSVHIGNWYPVFNSIRAESVQAYDRPFGGAFPLPTMHPPRPAAIMPQVKPDPAFELARTYAPEITPVNYIQFGLPTPPRWADLPHWEHPFRQVSNGTKANPKLKQYEQPLDWKLEISNSPIPQSEFIHKRVPPPPSMKERKIKLSGTALAAWHAVGAATETVDFINVIYKNLPARFKSGEKTPQDKLQAIYHGWHEIDLLDLTADIIAMQIEDRIYGEFGKGLGQVSKKLNLPVGFGVSSIYKTIRYASGGVSN